MGKSNYNYIKQFFKKWEGGWANDPDDRGGCTMSGITISTYKKYYGKDKTCEDLKKLSEDEWDYIFRKGYYDKCKCDKINNPSVALLVCQCAWGSGPVTALKKIQSCIGCKSIDGIVGPETLEKLNNPNSQYIFQRLWQMRYVWLCNIASVGNNKKFLNGWLRRLSDIKYTE